MNTDLLKELTLLNDSKIEKFTFNGIVTYAKCVANYDGDTVTLIFKYNNKFIKCNCRIVGIDSPEMHSKNVKLKKLAIKSKQFLADHILDKIVIANFGEFDKYGRILVNIKTLNQNGDQHNIKDLLIAGGYAVAYDGDKKLDDDKQVDMYNL
jgi:endonuclease YncB( thermonuclease family)